MSEPRRPLARRYCGEPVETPLIASQEPTLGVQTVRGPKGLPTLRDAFVGWKKEGTRASTTAVGYEHALDRWEQLHKRKATDITEVDGTQCLLVYSDKVAGQPLKTVGSARTIPRIDHELTCAR
jgi:hypothetical protein